MALRAEIEIPNSEKLDDDIMLMKPLWEGREVYAFAFGLYNLFYTDTLIKNFPTYTAIISLLLAN